MNRKILISAAAVLTIIGIGSCMRGGKLQTITVNPPVAIVQEGTPRQFTATARFSDGSEIDWTSSSHWSLSDIYTAVVGTMSGTHGLVTGFSTTANPITVMATDVANGITGTATLFITHKQLVALEITPINEIISAGTTTQFSAAGTYADGIVADGSQNADGTTEGTHLPPLTSLVTWNSSNTDVATVSNVTGSVGLVTAVAPGVTTITAKDAATQVSDSTQLIVQ